MGTYVVRRLLAALPVLLGVLVIAFVVLRRTPGGPAQAELGEKATPEKIAEINRRHGWDQPLPVQFLRYCGRSLRGDFGTSTHTKQPVATDLAQRIPATMELALAAMALAVLVGVPLGIVASLRPGRAVDVAASGAALLGVSLPVFFLGLLLILACPFMPTGSRLPVGVTVRPWTGLYCVDALVVGDWRGFGAALRHLALPALTLATVPLAVVARMTRSSMLEVLGEDYVRTARAKGLPMSRVVLRHALRNALVPIVTVIGLNVGYLLAGAVLTETVFAWPGLGRYVVHAIEAKDYNAVQASLLFVAAVFVGMNLLVDVSYAWIDPRVRLRADRA